MADVIIKLKIMPASPEVDLNKIEAGAKKRIENFGGKLHKTEREPVAFGLNAINFIFLLPEEKGSTEPLEAELKRIEGVNSAEVVDVRRAFG